MNNATDTKTVWHSLSSQAVLSELDVSIESGLSTSQASERQKTYGLNELPGRKSKPAVIRFMLQFHNPLIYVLLVAAITTLVLSQYVDAVVILSVVLINTLIGFIQEGKAEKSLEAVRGMLAERATVIREGRRMAIASSQLTPGDIIFLESGDKVPADIRILYSKNLQISEAVLTGESLPISKTTAEQPAEAVLADRKNMAYSGTLVTAGQGTGVVIQTGQNTEIGRIGMLVGGLGTLTTPLTKRLDQFAKQISVFIVITGLLIYGYGIAFTGFSSMDLFLAIVGLSVAAIPEGLPAIVSVVLAIGTRAMAQNRAIIRRLPAVETLGSVTVICSDKTGTLTRNEMTAVNLMLANREIEVTGSGYAPEGEFLHAGSPVDPLDQDIQGLAYCALLCNDAEIRLKDSQWEMIGDPTEGALIALAMKAGLDSDKGKKGFIRLDTIPFESEYRYMAVLVGSPTQDPQVMLKGAPEVLLGLCNADTSGEAYELNRWLERVKSAAESGQRVLALATKSVGSNVTTISRETLPKDFTLLGLIGIIDPPREEAIAAVAMCQSAGIRVKMITGDHAITAGTIGRRLGLSAEQTLTGEDIEKMSDGELQACSFEVDIIARASPEHKLRLVAALQSQGHLVAMTGDGVNDAPALKSANIGIAMGQKGTDAAREASDLVLTDDNFATISKAVFQGRIVYDNIKKSLVFILPTNGGQAGVILLAILLGMTLPITAGQILWVNLITSVTLAVALAFEPAERELMNRPPRSAKEPLLTAPLLSRILLVSTLIIGSTFFVFDWSLSRGDSIEVARTSAVNMIMLAQLAYVFQARHYTESGLSLDTFTGNRTILWMGGLLLIAQLSLTYLSPLNSLFRTSAIDVDVWLIILALSTAVFFLIELEKLIWRRLKINQM
jgi:magnesium-transporting ATPase (P-type)